jgi:hypothetical protein
MEMWTAGAAAIPDMFGVCGVDSGLVVLELVSVDGLAARDSLRLVGFPVMGSWADRRISCWRVRIGVGLSVCSRFAIKFPLVVGSSCDVSGSCEKTLIEINLKIVASQRGQNLLCGLSKLGNKLVVICNYVWLN